ncbi:hypothetical protein FQN55_008390 [Onygenales sp. PD_40]|nr:hypothetical protein FQN55_008390 [Onygenales sp. PD_40]
MQHHIENASSPPPEATAASSRELPEAVVVRDNYPEVVPLTDDIYYYKSPEGQLPVAPDGAHENVAGKHPPERGCSNLRSRTLLVTLVLAIIAIAAIIGGSVGGTWAKKHGEDHSSTGQNASNNAQRAIAAANCSGNYVMVYQQSNGILDGRGYSNTTWTWFSFSNLTVENPRMNTPISVLCDRDARHVSIFYVSRDHILQHVRLASNWDFNELKPWHPGAVSDFYVSPHSTLVSYYTSTEELGSTSVAVLDDNGKIFDIELLHETTIQNLTPLHGFNPRPSSPLAAAYNGTDLQLYWVNKEGYLEGSLRNDTHNVWSSGLNFPSTPGSMVATQGPGLVTIFYTENLEVKTVNSEMGTPITNVPFTSSVFPKSNVPFGPIAVAYEQLFYVVGNKIAEVDFDIDSQTYVRTGMEPIPWTDEEETTIKL